MSYSSPWEDPPSRVSHVRSADERARRRAYLEGKLGLRPQRSPTAERALSQRSRPQADISTQMDPAGLGPRPKRAVETREGGSSRPVDNVHTEPTLPGGTERLIDIYQQMADRPTEEEAGEPGGASPTRTGMCSGSGVGDGDLGPGGTSTAEGHPTEMPSPFGTPRLRPRVRLRVCTRGQAQANGASHSSSGSAHAPGEHNSHNHQQAHHEDDGMDEDDLAV